MMLLLLVMLVMLVVMVMLRLLPVRDALPPVLSHLSHIERRRHRLPPWIQPSLSPPPPQSLWTLPAPSLAQWTPRRLGHSTHPQYRPTALAP